MSFKTKLCVVSSTVLALAVSQGARAQQVDYGALEQMFGEPVTTSATGSPQTASQVPANMKIITADDIRRSGATDIPDILRFIAGVDVRTNGVMDSEVAIGGFSQIQNPRLLVLVNGRQVYFDDYGKTSWQTIPVQLNDIRQIEVVEGPASALFGFNATSGVINIITYDPLYDKTNVANVTAGSDGLLSGSVVATAQLAGKAGITLSAGGLQTHEYSTSTNPPGGATTIRDPHRGNFNFDARYKPTAKTEIDAEVTASSARSEDVTVIDLLLLSRYATDSGKLGFSADTGLGLFSVQGYLNQIKNNFILPGIARVDYYTQLIDLQASDLVKLNDTNAVRAGFEYRDDRAWGDGVFNHSIGYQDVAASLMWNWQITPTLALTNAGRIDHLVLNRTNPLLAGNIYTLADYQHAAINAPTFNSGLVWQPTGQDTIRLLAGRGVQSPSLVQFGLQVPLVSGVFSVLQLGNPLLKPSTETNYEVDYDRQVPALLSTIKTAFFYQVDRGLLSSPNGVPAVFTPPSSLSAYSQNIGNGQAVGGQIGISGACDAGWRWNLSYTLTAVRSKLTYLPPATPYHFNNATPVSVIDFGLGYNWHKWEADLQGKWQSGYTDYRNAGGAFAPFYVRNYVTFNARLGYQLTPRLTLAVAGQQLPGPQTIESAWLPPDRRVLFSATYGF